MKTSEIVSSPSNQHNSNANAELFFQNDPQSIFQGSIPALQTKPFFDYPKEPVDSGIENILPTQNDPVLDASNLSAVDTVVQPMCDECAEEEVRKEPIQEKPAIQTKPILENENIQTQSPGGLTVGEPDDQYEQEADTMADQVVQKMTDPAPPTLDEEDEVKANPEAEIQEKPIFESESNEDILQAKILIEQSTVGSQEPTTINETHTESPNIQACEACEQEEKLENEEEAPTVQKKTAVAGDEQNRNRIDQFMAGHSWEEEQSEKSILFKLESTIQRSGGGSTDESSVRNRIEHIAKKEIGKVEAKRDDGSGRRVGADRLLEFFHLAAPGEWSDEVIENVKYTSEAKQFPHWCAIFSVYVIKKAGIDVGNWKKGVGVSQFNTLEQTDSPQKGDIGYIHKPWRHHCIITEVNGDTIKSIDGNSGTQSEVVERTRPRTEYTGFFTAFTGSMKRIQKKEDTSTADVSNNSLQDQLDKSSGNGALLEDSTKDQMESGFGADFSNVNIHTNSESIEMNRSLQSQAFTHGSDIYFNEGKYNPETDSGQHLLAHELTHTIQQGGVASDGPGIQKQGPGHDDDNGTPDPNSNQSTSSGVIEFDDVEICEEQGIEIELFKLPKEEIPLWIQPIPAPPPIFELNATLSAELGASLGGTFSYGPCKLTDIRLTYNTENGRYTGSGRFHLPGEVAITLSATGGLKGALDWLGLIELFALTGTLGFSATGAANVDWITNMDLIYENEEFSFEGSEDLEGRSSLGGQIDFTAAAELFGFDIWEHTWPLHEWSWEKEHIIRDIIRVKYEDGEWAIFTTEITNEGFTGRELAAEADNMNQGVAPSTSEDYPLSDILSGVQIHPDSTTDPDEIILALLQATPEERLEATTHPATMAALEHAVGSDRWPEVVAILNNEMSSEVPMLTVDAVFTIKYYIDREEYVLALQYLVEQLIELGEIDTRLAIFQFSASDEGLYGLARVEYERDDDENLVPKGPSTITIYLLAYANISLMLSTILHEYVHARQQQRSIAPGDVDRTFGDIRDNEREVQAYLHEIERSRETGLFSHADLMRGKWYNLRDYYGRLSEVMEDEYASQYHVAQQIVIQAIIAGAEENEESPDIGDIVADPVELPAEPITDVGDDEHRERCYRGELPKEECDIPFNQGELEIINSLGERRNVDVNPDVDKDQDNPDGVHRGGQRPDDAPVMLQFRVMYNLLDRWRLYINQNEPELYDFFESEFIDGGHFLTELMDEVKLRTKEYKADFRNLNNQDTQQLTDGFLSYLGGKVRNLVDRTNRAARWYQVELAGRGTYLSIPEIQDRVNTGGFLIWRDKWLQASLDVNRILLAAWPPAKQLIMNWVVRNIPNGDADSIEDIDYIGSLAKGYKGPPKQHIEFYTRNFDVDANLTAPVLADYGVEIKGAEVDRGSINSGDLEINEIEDFKADVHEDMSNNVFGYDEEEEFEIFIKAEHTTPHDENERLDRARNEVYELRERLDEDTYRTLLCELDQADFIVRDEHDRLTIHDKVKNQEDYDRFMEIIDRYKVQSDNDNQ